MPSNIFTVVFLGKYVKIVKSDLESFYCVTHILLNYIDTISSWEIFTLSYK